MVLLAFHLNWISEKGRVYWLLLSPLPSLSSSINVIAKVIVTWAKKKGSRIKWHFFSALTEWKKENIPKIWYKRIWRNIQERHRIEGKKAREKKRKRTYAFTCVTWREYIAQTNQSVPLLSRECTIQKKTFVHFISFDLNARKQSLGVNARLWCARTACHIYLNYIDKRKTRQIIMDKQAHQKIQTNGMETKRKGKKKKEEKKKRTQHRIDPFQSWTMLNIHESPVTTMWFESKLIC